MGEKERNMETTVKTTISAMDSVTIKEAVRLIEAATPSGLRIASISGEVFFADGEVHVGAGSISVAFEPGHHRSSANRSGALVIPKEIRR